MRREVLIPDVLSAEEGRAIRTALAAGPDAAAAVSAGIDAFIVARQRVAEMKAGVAAMQEVENWVKDNMRYGRPGKPVTNPPAFRARRKKSRHYED